MNKKYIQMYARLAGVRRIVFRLLNIYGNWQRLDKCEEAIRILLNKVLQGKPVEICRDGEVLRGFIHVDDVVRMPLFRL